MKYIDVSDPSASVLKDNISKQALSGHIVGKIWKNRQARIAGEPEIYSVTGSNLDEMISSFPELHEKGWCKELLIDDECVWHKDYEGNEFFVSEPISV